MGRKKDPSWRGLPALRIEIILARFQTKCVSAARFDRLKRRVRYSYPLEPRCFRSGNDRAACVIDVFFNKINCEGGVRVIYWVVA